jgi:hypothetical protein
MQSNFWKIFKRIVSLTALPLIALIFIFRGDEKRGWIVVSAQVVLFSYGLIGGVMGFIKYGIRQEPVPMPAHPRFRQIAALRAERIARPTQNQPRYKILCILLVCIALFSMAGFAFCVNRVIENGPRIVVVAGSQVILSEPGMYTLWVKQLESNATVGQMTIERASDKASVQAVPIWGSEVLRENGERYDALCKFRIVQPGQYLASSSSRAAASEMFLQRSLTVGLAVSTLMLFVAGAGSMIGAVYLRFFKMSQPASGIVGSG